jgi:hypothetical protein
MMLRTAWFLATWPLRKLLIDRHFRKMADNFVCPECNRLLDGIRKEESAGATNVRCECGCLSRWELDRKPPYLLGYSGSPNPLEDLYSLESDDQGD